MFPLDKESPDYFEIEKRKVASSSLLAVSGSLKHECARCATSRVGCGSHRSLCAIQEGLVLVRTLTHSHSPKKPDSSASHINHGAQLCVTQRNPSNPRLQTSAPQIARSKP
ncbi:uncharacterized protein LOC110674216 [Aedes aegypti]|uniref:Uncharacterized protein n=1 Tax=Aedes aegypti TaxID=7159 RepID=A0A6I8U339_AEDAE|nr:uncharacterized protein LOC110674216 [Aedes aegypti]